mmetsp:Transcript_306/g.518  ORF Transcript_306/g.518 Transcript_306/m.518 type:complete len:364 (-) Transcript_306:14-1105(-)
MSTAGSPSSMGDTTGQHNARRENRAEIMDQQVVMEEMPRILRNNHLKCLPHTPETAQILHDTHGFFANGREMSHQVEQHLFDAFIEDDYDGHLHLMTLHSVVESKDVNGVSFGETGDDINIRNSSFDNDLLGPPLGIVFWRDVSDEEMREWFDWKYLTKAFGQDKPIKNGKIREIVPSKNTEDSLKPIGKDETLHLVRQSSIYSIQNMVKDMYLPSTVDDDTAVSSTTHDGESRLDRINKELDNVDNNLTHAWIKLELIAVRQQYWGNHLGSLLLACALHHAHSKLHQSRVILHVAGGAENIPAVRLYERFGFHPVPQGTLFHKPDRYIYVLGDIARSLGGITWNEGALEVTTTLGDKLLEDE